MKLVGLLFGLLVGLVTNAGWAQSTGGGCTWNPCNPSVAIQPNGVLTTDPNGNLAFTQTLPGGGGVPASVQCVSTANAGGAVDAITIPKLPCASTTTLLILTTIGQNLTATPTITVSGDPVARIIMRANGTVLAPNDLPPSGGKALLASNGTNWFLLNLPAQAQLTASVTGTPMIADMSTGNSNFIPVVTR